MGMALAPLNTHLYHTIPYLLDEIRYASATWHLPMVLKDKTVKFKKKKERQLNTEIKKQKTS